MTKITHPLIVEQHPDTYEGFPFITLIRYRKETLLGIVDNASDKFVRVYVIDLCQQYNVDEESLIDNAFDWYESDRKCPFSIFLTKTGNAADFLPVYRELNTEHITRVIGPLPLFDMSSVSSRRRKKKKPLDQGVLVDD